MDFQPPHHKQNSGVGTKSRSQILQIMDHTWNLDNKLATHLSMKTAVPAHYYWHAQKKQQQKEIKILYIERSTFSNSPLSNSHNLKKKLFQNFTANLRKLCTCRALHCTTAQHLNLVKLPSYNFAPLQLGTWRQLWQWFYPFCSCQAFTRPGISWNTATPN